MRSKGVRVAIVLAAILSSIGVWPGGIGAYGVGSWSPTGSMRGVHYSATATTLRNGMVLVAGGSDGAPSRASELYDAAAGEWRPTGSLAARRSRHTATVLADGRVLAVGGLGDGFTFLDSAEIYDPASGTWRGAASMQFRRNDHSAVLLADGMVLVVGGTNGANDSPIPHDRAERYDPASNRWVSTAPSPVREIMLYSATALANGQVLIVGQLWSGGNLAQLYDPATDRWLSTGSPSERYDYTAKMVLLADGSALLVGGGTSSAERYDPATGTWRSAGAMLGSRSGHTVERLGDGRVIAIGGCCRSNSAELYDPVSNSWSSTGALINGRQYHSSAVLPDGRVLVASGTLGWDNFTTTAELYTLTGAVAALSPTTVTFGTQPLNTSSSVRSVALTNAGTTPITVASISITGAHASDFATGADTCTAGSIAPGQRCTVGVNFAPRFSGQRAATLTFHDDAPGSPHTVALFGTGSFAPTIGSLSPTHARAGDGSFIITVGGVNFAPGATLLWNGAPRATTVIASTLLTAQIESGDIADVAVDDVQVVNPDPNGGTSAPHPFFTTANGTAITGLASATSTDPAGTVIAAMGGTGPQTPGSLTAIANGAGTITVAGYADNPGGTPTFGTGTSSTVGGYLDLYVAPGSAFTRVQVINCALNDASAVFWWDGAQWARASEQAITSPGCSTMTVTATSSPSLSQLGGTYLATGRQLVFGDVPSSHPAYEAIRELSARGIVRGYSDGTFGPREFTLRAQMAALIARSMGWSADDRGNPFPDQGLVDDELWRNVGTLHAYGVAQGYDDGTYNPTGDVLAHQAILFISRAMIAQGYWLAQPDDGRLYPNVPGTTARQQADRRDIATYVHYAGALPDMPAADGQPFVGWDQPATRAWFARALWQALISHYGGAANVP